MRIRIVAIIALSTMVAGCKKQVDSNDLSSSANLYQSYDLAYNKSSNVLEAQATFYKAWSGGAYVALIDGASIQLNGENPKNTSVYKDSYKWYIKGIPPSATFVLTKNTGEKITNTITLAELGDIDFDSVPDTISKSKGFQFTWKGEIRDKHPVKLIFRGYERQLDSNKITITPANMQSVDTLIALYIVRESYIGVKQQDGDANGIIEYSIGTGKNVVVIP